MPENNANEKALDLAKEIVKDVYADGGRPVVQPTGELLGLVPRAVKAALAPLEKWILQKEYNIAETKKLLEEKLKDTLPELIQPPEAHVAVPALQYISYCMDNEELRDMYANLLANSMNKIVKNGVHPGFVEIIKQLCPDEAKILRYLSQHTSIPTITLRAQNDKGEGIDFYKNFSNVGELTGCERPFDVSKYFDNLVRLGLIGNAAQHSALTNKKLYEPLKNHKHVLQLCESVIVQKSPYNNIVKNESYVFVTSFGKSFCDICLSNKKTITVEILPRE